jgi:hypothetical protein
MPRDASELARRLAREAEAVCRHYLSNGKRKGRYWLVGDVHNSRGGSMFVRLQDSPKRPAGKWTDAATGEHGDLLDIIRESLGLGDFREVAEEARRFLKLPRPEPEAVFRPARPAASVGSQEAARRLFAISGTIEGTVVETYLQRRGISCVHHGGSLRFHPRCYYRPDEHLPTETWPAMIACVTDLNGWITGAHRTWLDPDGFDRIRLGKAPIDTPRRAMGSAMRCVSVRRMTTCLLPAKASRPCCHCAMHCRPCRWPQRFPRIISQRCSCRQACVGSISLEMTMLRETLCKQLLPSVHKKPASRQSRCHPGWATSTRTCTSSGSMLYERRCGFSSRRRTSTVFFSSTAIISDREGSMSTARSRLMQCRRGRSLGLLEGDRTAAGPSRQWLRPAIFRRPIGPLHREAK